MAIVLTLSAVAEGMLPAVWTSVSTPTWLAVEVPATTALNTRCSIDAAVQLASTEPLLLQDAVNSYLYGLGGSPYAQVNRTSGAITYLHSDLIGSTRAATNSVGAATGTWDYDAYGNVAGHTGTAATPFLYAGQYRDVDTRLYYLRARYYDPATATFLTRDPVQATTRLPYGYTTGNPLQDSDPTGTCSVSTWAESLFDFPGYAALGGTKCDREDRALTASANLNNIGAVSVQIGASAFANGVLEGAKNGPFARPCGDDPYNVMGQYYGMIFITALGAINPEEGPEASAISAAERLAANTARVAEGALSPTLKVGERSYIYGDRLPARAVEEGGPYHNFPSSLDQEILSRGVRTEVSEGYVQYTLRGSINGVDGVYEMGARLGHAPQVSRTPR